MTLMTMHRRPAGDPDAVRFVPDGFRWSVFLLPPAGLFARRLWGAGAVWLVLIAAIAGAAAGGLVSPVAATAALLVANLMFAIDAPEMERRQLARHGWPLVAMTNSRAPFADNFAARDAAAKNAPTGASRAQMPAASDSADVIGVFPDGRGR